MATLAYDPYRVEIIIAHLSVGVAHGYYIRPLAGTKSSYSFSIGAPASCQAFQPPAIE